jgi:hypothetical protein
MPMPGIGGGEGRRPAREVAAVQQRGSGGIPYSSFREFEWMQIKSFLSQHHYCIKCLLGLPQPSEHHVFSTNEHHAFSTSEHHAFSSGPPWRPCLSLLLTYFSCATSPPQHTDRRLPQRLDKSHSGFLISPGSACRSTQSLACSCRCSSRA